MIKSPARLIYVICSNLSQQLEDGYYQTDTIQPDEIEEIMVLQIPSFSFRLHQEEQKRYYKEACYAED